jgi:hypothetical protein
MTRKTKNHRSKSFTLPLAVVAGFGPLIYTTYKHAQWNGMGGEEGAIDVFVRSLTGFSPSTAYGRVWEFKRLMWGLMPILGGLVAHKIAGRLGVNKAISSAGIPFIRV